LFIDTETIEGGDEWPQRISNALRKASVFMPIIGPRWLAAHDKSHRRRIDLPEDWVRREVEHALRSGKAVMPVLVSGAEMPRGEELPASLVDLAHRRPVRVEEKADIRSIVDLLATRYAFREIATDLDYPTPVDTVPDLSHTELDEALRRIPEWSLAERDSTRAKGKTSLELVRVYKFKSFRDAIHFMANVARYIDVTDHHPNWENQYKDVRVRLTTWDIGHRVSWKDVRLAEHLDRQYREYVAFDVGGGNQPF
jgi:pterin-4a-carbinolamine dehydratase